MKKQSPLAKMVREAQAKLSRAEARSLPCGERRKLLSVAVKIDTRLRDYAMHMIARQRKLPSQSTIAAIGRLNRLVPQVKRVVRAACGYHH